MCCGRRRLERASIRSKAEGGRAGVGKQKEVGRGACAGRGEGLRIFPGQKGTAMGAATSKGRGRCEPPHGQSLTGPGVIRDSIVYIPTSAGMLPISARDGVEVKPTS